VHESLIGACESLEKKRYTYPSAYLVPSLFRHPDSTLFRLRPTLRQQLLPKTYEWVMLIALLILSIPLPVQDWLTGQRMLMQSHFRTMTQQTELPVSPVLLVQIDQRSIEEAGIQDPYPMDRQYLARLVNHVSNLGAKTIGIDYLLDRPLPGDQSLVEALQSSAAQGTRFVFAAFPDAETNQWLTALPQFANPAWSRSGDISVFGDAQTQAYLIPYPSEPGTPLPFAYELASLHQQLRSGQPFRSGQQPLASPYRPSSLTQTAWKLGQTWLHPIVDFSLPIDEVFTSIPAWQLLELTSAASSRATEKLHAQAVLIVPSGYEQAGLTPGSDNFNLPAAMRYWRDRQDPRDDRLGLPASELQAYLSEHFLSNRFVTPIPDLWLVAFAFLVGKGIALQITPRIGRRSIAILWLMGGTVVYVLLSFGLYISSAGLLVPIVLPTVMVWTFVLPAILHRTQSEIQR
jgi:hypothetical protein